MRYIEDVEIYDPTKVGSRIACGRTHSVYRYGDSEVIRFPHAERWLEFLLRDGLNLHDRYKRDIFVCKQYLADYFLTTRVVENAVGKVATIQPYITGHYLSKKDLKDEPTRLRFQDMIEQYKTMVTAGYEVDLIGQGGILQRCLSNVFVLDDGSLKLFDATVVDMRKIDNATHVAQFITRLVLKRQRSTVQMLLS